MKILLPIILLCITSPCLGERKKSTYKIYDWLQSLGRHTEQAKSIINQCKDKAKDPLHCIMVASSIWCAESSCWKTKNPFWLMSKDKSFSRWIKSYNKYRYLSSTGVQFYWWRGRLWKYMYCYSEESSGSKLWCPIGAKNFNNSYNKLKEYIAK